MTKVHVTLKSVEAANAKLQLGRLASGDRSPVLAVNIKSPPPSREAFAAAGQRALQSFKK